MPSRFFPILTILALTISADALAAERVLTSFSRNQLTTLFMCEGAAIGDFNRDGKADLVSGPYWYAGPDFTNKYEIYPPMAYEPIKYSANFLTYTYDFDGDKFDDVLVFGFPGKETLWFRNPGKEELWKSHVALDITDNESPTLVDITGDGKPEIVCNRKGYVGYAEADWSEPTKPWTWHNVSQKGKWHKYTHGMGVGDINSDGRLDIVMREGWWEQPATLKNDTEWTFHAVDFGEGGAQMLVYDVDGDKRNDVVTSIQAHGWGLAWFQQQADGSFTRQQIIGQKTSENPYGVAFSQMHALALADIDGDGLQDVVTGKRYWAHGPKKDPEPNAPAVLYWFQLVRSSDEASFIPHLVDDNSGVGTQVTVGDLSGDGRPDILVGNKKGTFVFTNTGKTVTEEEWQAAQPRPTK